MLAPNQRLVRRFDFYFESKASACDFRDFTRLLMRTHSIVFAEYKENGGDRESNILLYKNNTYAEISICHNTKTAYIIIGFIQIVEDY